MPKCYSSRHIATVLKKNGFQFISQKGSHAKYRKSIDGKIVMVVVPMSKQEVFYGTFKAILDQSRLAKEDFQK
ncbi:MAG: YcfA family protein [Candidatus Nomurabacteria bacterium]|nr:YcfA family protein [Candidatus Nomurabacteria bacterium]